MPKKSNKPTLNIWQVVRTFDIEMLDGSKLKLVKNEFLFLICASSNIMVFATENGKRLNLPETVKTENYVMKVDL